MQNDPLVSHNNCMVICKRVRYVGRVQGVGFRYTAHQLAEGFPVAGYVRNLPTGDVELVVQGEAEQVTAFLAAVNRRMAGYIEKTIVHDTAGGDFQGFKIRH
jgi:acylphosphatase